MIDLVIKWAVPALCTGLVVFVTKQHSFKKAMKSSQLAMIRSHIAMQCKTYLNLGYLDENDRYCLEELFENYQLLGGNHGIEALVNKCFLLPLEK